MEATVPPFPVHRDQADMVWIPWLDLSHGVGCPLPGGSARPPSDRGRLPDRPQRVTNREFAAFVEDTGYVTVAERAPDPAEFPGAPPENLVAMDTKAAGVTV